MHLRSTSDDYRSSPNKTAIKIQKLPSRFKQPQWHLQFIIQVMDHELQSGSFSSSDDQGQKIPGPTAAMISKYNREYSTMVKQIDRFLETAISSVQKFVTFHNFGVDFNLPLLLNSLNFASSNFRLHLNAMSQLDHKEAKKTAKNKYEVSFNNLVLRMGSLLKDIVDCQVEFKKSYFANQTSPQNSKQRAPTNRSASRLNRSASLTESSTSQNKKFSQLVKNEANQQQKEPQLRSTLNQKLKPKALSFQPECKTQYSTTQNLYRLNEKLGVMLNDMKAMRGRQQKLIELFNLNRVKKLQMIEEQPSALNTSTISSIAPINEYQEEMDQILEDWRGRQSAASEAEDIYSRRGFLKKRTIF